MLTKKLNKKNNMFMYVYLLYIVLYSAAIYELGGGGACGLNNLQYYY